MKRDRRKVSRAWGVGRDLCAAWKEGTLAMMKGFRIFIVAGVT